MFTLKPTRHAQRTLAQADIFTAEERLRLEALRVRYEATDDCGEFGLDEAWLLYARWLVEHRRISEGVETRF